MPKPSLRTFQYSKKRSLIIRALVYLGFFLLLWFFALLIYSKILEFIALMFLAGTFLPMPADTYVLYMAEFLNPVEVALIGGLVNSLAVIFEKYWLIDLMKFGYFEKFSAFFAKTKFTRYMNKYMFVSLFISAFSILPFEPFRLVAVTKNYNNSKYFLATFLGRGFRYYLLALVGQQFMQYDLLGFILILSLSGFLWGIYKMLRNK